MAIPKKVKPARQAGSGLQVQKAYAEASGGELVVKSDLPTPETLNLSEIRSQVESQGFDELIQLAADTRRQLDRIDAAGAAYIGTVLLAAREKCPHGDFLPWLAARQETLGISQRSAYRYMQLAEYWEPLGMSDKFATVANFGLAQCYEAINAVKASVRTLPTPKMGSTPRKTFQEPRRLRKLAATLRDAFLDVEPQNQSERALLKRVEELIERLEVMAGNSQLLAAPTTSPMDRVDTVVDVGSN